MGQGTWRRQCQDGDNDNVMTDQDIVMTDQDIVMTDQDIVMTDLHQRLRYRLPHLWHCHHAKVAETLAETQGESLGDTLAIRFVSLHSANSAMLHVVMLEVK